MSVLICQQAEIKQNMTQSVSDTQIMKFMIVCSLVYFDSFYFMFQMWSCLLDHISSEIE